MIALGRSGDASSLYLIKRQCTRGFAAVLAGCAGIALMAGTTSTDVHAAGCQGQSASSDTGAASQAATVDALQDTIAQAKANSGLGATPVYGGVAFSGVHVDHDGYTLKNPVSQEDCGGAPIAPINELQPFRSTAYTLGALGEIDLSSRMSGYTVKLGAGISGKSVQTNYRGDNLTPASAAVQDGPFAPEARTAGTIGVRTGNGNVDEDGVLFDFYSVVAKRQTYLITTGSFGFGDSDVTNIAFNGFQFVNGIPGPDIEPATFGGGRGETDYFEYSFSGTVGHVFQARRGDRLVLIDVSGGLLYSDYERDGFTDTAGVTYSDATSRTFAGVAAVTIAVPMAQHGWQYSPFLKGAVKQRFDFDSKVTVSNPTTGLCAVPDGSGGFDCSTTQTYNLDSDDTSFRVGAGFTGESDSGRTASAFEIFYGGAGDFNEFGGRAQLLFKLN